MLENARWSMEHVWKYAITPLKGLLGACFSPNAWQP